MFTRFAIPIVAICLSFAYWQIAQSLPKMSLQAGYGPGFFPTIIAGFVILMASLELASVAAQWLSTRTPVADGPAEGATFGADLLAASLLVISVATYTLLTPQIGFIAAAATMLLGLSVLMGLRPLWQSVVFSIFASVSLYMIFHKFFGVSFPN